MLSEAVMKSVITGVVFIYLFNLCTPCDEMSVKAECEQKLSSEGRGPVCFLTSVLCVLDAD